VLLVDDDPSVERLVADCLPGAVLERVGRLAAALERLAADPWDAVLLDVSLPDCIGLEAVRVLNARAPQVPVVVLTGLEEEDLALNAVQQGAEDYLVKEPMVRELLLRSIRFAVERHRRRAALEALSLVDAQTGLYNSRGFRRLGEAKLRLARRLGKGVSLLVFDLDRFGELEELYGQRAGSSAVGRAATLLRATFRESDLLGRLGRNVFSVLAMTDAPHGEDRMLDRLARKLDGAAGAPAALAYRTRSARVPAGHEMSLDALIAAADAPAPS